MKPLILFFNICLATFSAFAQFEAGEDVRVSKPYPDDIYMAGGNVTIDAPVHGDCVLAGGTINVNDSVTSDLIIGGGDINVTAYVGDDIRIAGGTIRIDSEVMDDLIVFGGEIKVSPNAVIHGNVVSYGGELEIDGTVLGALKASGGEIEVDGSVHGPATLSAGSLQIRDGAKFFSDVAYWSEAGEVDFGNSVQNGEARFDTSLSWEGNDYADAGTLFGLSLLFMFLFVLGGFLIVLVLELAFGKWFSEAAKEVVSSWSRSLGIGVIYVIGVPILVLLCFMIVIGIPIGLFAMVLYLFSMIFGNFVAGLVITHLWKARNGKDWGVVLTALIALVMAIVLQLLTSIPFLGFVISFGVLCMTYGAIILGIMARNAGNSGTAKAVLTETVG